MLAYGCGFLNAYGRYNMMGGGWLMMLLPVLLIGFAVYAIMRTSQNNSNNNSHYNSNNDALNILNKRYAQGEISEEEYIQKKNILKD